MYGLHNACNAMMLVMPGPDMPTRADTVALPIADKLGVAADML